jgi:hypothetical protein
MIGMQKVSDHLDLVYAVAPISASEPPVLRLLACAGLQGLLQERRHEHKPAVPHLHGDARHHAAA